MNDVEQRDLSGAHIHGWCLAWRPRWFGAGRLRLVGQPHRTEAGAQEVLRQLQHSRRGHWCVVAVVTVPEQ